MLTRGLLFRIVGAAHLLVAVFAGGASAQNRIVLNPDFNDAEQGSFWQSSSGTWVTTVDADGCHDSPVGSGSLLTESIFDGGGEGISVAFAKADDCLDVLPGQEIQTEIAYRSPFGVGAGGEFYPQAGCGGVPGGITVFDAVPASENWARAAIPVVVPAGRFSMKVAWASFDIENSAFETQFDRAYAGALPRVFADDFEASTLCRWSSNVGGEDTEPPSVPGSVASPTHDGGAAPPPMQFTWSASTDTGGSGLARYRASYGAGAGPISCSALGDIGLVTQAQTDDNLPPGNYLFAICAEENAGNQSAVVVTGPYVVN